jgi:hypothetical protein
LLKVRVRVPGAGGVNTVLPFSVRAGVTRTVELALSPPAGVNAAEYL